MAYNKTLIEELKTESAATRKMLAQVPTDKNDWKPHAKSMKLGNLATHIAELPGWVVTVVTEDELDLATMAYKPNIPNSTEELLANHDAHVEKALAALEGAIDADFDKMWTLRRGEHIMFTQPKKAILRSLALSHLYHHRGQLSVYLRLLDVHVPGMYGPSADEIAARAQVAAN